MFPGLSHSSLAYYGAVPNAGVSANAHRRVREHICKLTVSVHGGCERYLAINCRHLSVIMSLTADAADGENGYRSSAESAVQTPVDADGISVRSENVRICTSLICIV